MHNLSNGIASLIRLIRLTNGIVESGYRTWPILWDSLESGMRARRASAIMMLSFCLLREMLAEQALKSKNNLRLGLEFICEEHPLNERANTSIHHVSAVPGPDCCFGTEQLTTFFSTGHSSCPSIALTLSQQKRRVMFSPQTLALGSVVPRSFGHLRYRDILIRTRHRVADEQPLLSSRRYRQVYACMHSLSFS